MLFTFGAPAASKSVDTSSSGPAGVSDHETRTVRGGRWPGPGDFGFSGILTWGAAL